MKKTIIILTVFFLCWTTSCFAGGSPYEDTVSSWESYKDVGSWLESNFSFDKKRQQIIQKRLKAEGPSGLLVLKPEKLFAKRKGYCGDAANFALSALNKINPAYNARWVFIKNAKGPPHHWVTAFDYNEKLYVMDYGTGEKWRPMKGVHGPYDSLDDYRIFLDSLKISKFEVGEVMFRDMPGAED